LLLVLVSSIFSSFSGILLLFSISDFSSFSLSFSTIFSLSFLFAVSNGDSWEIGDLTTQTLFLVLTGAWFTSLLFSFSSSISEDSAWVVAGISEFESLFGTMFSSSLFSFSPLIGTLFSVLTGVSSSWLLVLSGTAVGISLFSCSGSLSSFPLLIVLSFFFFFFFFYNMLDKNIINNTLKIKLNLYQYIKLICFY